MEAIVPDRSVDHRRTAARHAVPDSHPPMINPEKGRLPRGATRLLTRDPP